MKLRSKVPDETLVVEVKHRMGRIKDARKIGKMATQNRFETMQKWWLLLGN